MQRRWVRIAVVVVTLATLGFSGQQIRRSERAIDDERSLERVFNDLSWALTLSLGDLTAAEQAYVAAGQDRTYWTAKANSHLDTVRGSIDNLKRLATEPTSIDALDSALGAIADLERIDGRAREHAGLEQPLLASDLIFTDGLELGARAAAHVELARTTERAARSETVRATRAAQTTSVIAAAGVSLLAVLLLVPIRRSAASPPVASTEGSADGPATIGDVAPAGEDRLMLDDLALDAAAPESPDTASLQIDTASDAVSPPPASGTEPTPDLRVAADLCTDLSKLTDTAELPELLARAAVLMNAGGLILWVRDASGHALRPAIGHGYNRRTLARLGSIPEDGKNATAAAYRSARMQVVERDDTTGGALAAPLMSSDSCVGVLSAELREGWESSEAVQATAAIMAAQLATLLSADPPAESDAPPAEARG